MNGSYDDVKQALSETGTDHILFDEVEENPSLETIEKEVKLGRRIWWILLLGSAAVRLWMRQKR